MQASLRRLLSGPSVNVMSSPPQFIYKIFPSAAVDSRFYFPQPIPASHTFFLSELDYKDGFVHLSTADQVPRTLKRFFADVDGVSLLRLETGKLSAFKRVRWESNDGENFPHLYAHLEGENVESFREITQGPHGNWDDALRSIGSWLV